MSYDDSDDNNSEWEVVDIVHTTTTVKPDKKAKPAKKEDVDRLAAQIQAQLSMKTSQDTQQILLLEEKMKRQQKMSENQLNEIQRRLQQITEIQRQQEAQQRSLDEQRRSLEEQQKQQLLEQQIAIQSLSDNQMLTQKQLLEAKSEIKDTQRISQNVSDNVINLQQRQHQQALQQQMTEQQWNQQAQELHSQIQQQQQLKHLNQIQNQLNNQLYPTIHSIPPLQPSSFNLPPPPHQQPPSTTQPQPPQQPTNDTNNSWLPSLFGFGQKQQAKALSNGLKASSNTHVQDMDMTSSPGMAGIAMRNVVCEEKSHHVIEDDDDDVLDWNNDYGTHQVNPLHAKPELLKTKGTIGDGKYMPNEKRQCGWILQNQSKTYLKLSARLHCIGGDQQQNGIKIETEKVYEFELKPNEEVYVLIEVQAPSISGKYCAFYQLVVDEGVNIGEMLEVVCEVEAQFSKAKEMKIEQIIKMGFDDRKKVIATLQKNKWNVQRSIDQMI